MVGRYVDPTPLSQATIRSDQTGGEEPTIKETPNESVVRICKDQGIPPKNIHKNLACSQHLSERFPIHQNLGSTAVCHPAAPTAVRRMNCVPLNSLPCHVWTLGASLEERISRGSREFIYECIGSILLPVTVDDDGWVPGLAPKNSDWLVKPGPVTGKNGQTQ